MKMNVLSFSGGQTSGKMLRDQIDRIGLERYRNEFLTVFENTGKEHDATLAFVHQVEINWRVPIIWLEYCRIPAVEINPLWVPEGRMRSNLAKQQDQGEAAHWFRRVDFETAARYNDKRTPFDELLEWANVLPNVQTRMCSVQLKIRTRNRFLRANGIDAFNSFIGIRKDEEDRKLEILANLDQYETPHFPLCDAGIIKRDVDSFWEAHPFRLNIPNLHGNCRLCFLKARWKRVAVVRQETDCAQWWIAKEDEFQKKATGDGRFFRKGESYQGILNDALHPELDFSAKDEDVACSCAVGGYRHKDEIE